MVSFFLQKREHLLCRNSSRLVKTNVRVEMEYQGCTFTNNCNVYNLFTTRWRAADLRIALYYVASGPLVVVLLLFMCCWLNKYLSSTNDTFI